MTYRELINNMYLCRSMYLQVRIGYTGPRAWRISRPGAITHHHTQNHTKTTHRTNHQVTDWTSVLHASRLALLLPDATELASSLELRKHKREKRDCKTDSVCGAKKLQGFKAQGAKNPTPLHKAKLPIG